MAEGGKIIGKPQSVKQIFDRARGLATRVFSRSRQEQIMDIADRYAANIRAYLGDKYNINTEVPRNIYMGRKNNR